MDALIVERDPMVAEVLADALADVGITADITADEDQAIADCHDSGTRVMITGINRRGEDFKGMQFGRAMRARCPFLSVVYLAAVWPVMISRRVLDARERFLSKPVHVAKLVSTVRELLPAS
jgi:DNA-binding response OmpR family regulator